MQKRLRAARKRFLVPKRRVEAPMSRTDWIALCVAAALCLAWVAAFLVLGAGRALLYFSLPVYSVLERAEPTPVPFVRPAKEEAPQKAHIETERTEPAVPAAANSAQEAPQILIYHTHATEAYLPTEDDPYVPSGSWRTEDETKSVVAVGALLSELLREEYGFGVLHDTKNYEPPKLASAYGRSLSAMQAYQEQYPSLRVFIDVHRDAYGSGKGRTEPEDYLELGGEQVARLMFVVGTGEGATGTGFGAKPDFAANHALAQAITARLRAADGALARDVRVKTGRYNQHVSNACLLVEVGHNANTLKQALSAVPYLAAAIAACLDGGELPGELAAMSVWSP